MRTRTRLLAACPPIGRRSAISAPASIEAARPARNATRRYAPMNGGREMKIQMAAAVAARFRNRVTRGPCSCRSDYPRSFEHERLEQRARAGVWRQRGSDTFVHHWRRDQFTEVSAAPGMLTYVLGINDSERWWGPSTAQIRGTGVHSSAGRTGRTPSSPTRRPIPGPTPGR